MFGSSKDVSPAAERSSLSKLACVCGACEQQDSKRSDGNTLWRVVAAETVGTVLLVLLSCLGARLEPLLPRALAGGLVVTLLVQCFDHISGAMFNPTVALAAAMRGRIPLVTAAASCVAQVVGAVVGAGLLRLLVVECTENLCMTLPAENVSVYKAVTIEAVLGGCLALANCASWDPRNRLLTDSWPARVGLLVAGLSLVAGDLTGASMNPARSFGPALWAANFDRHWVYWLGPLGGSALCSALYSCAWHAGPAAPARACACAGRQAHDKRRPV